jgi:hypothetical protein
VHLSFLLPCTASLQEDRSAPIPATQITNMLTDVVLFIASSPFWAVRRTHFLASVTLPSLNYRLQSGCVARGALLAISDSSGASPVAAPKRLVITRLFEHET